MAGADHTQGGNMGPGLRVSRPGLTSPLPQLLILHWLLFPDLLNADNNSTSSVEVSELLYVKILNVDCTLNKKILE